MVIMFGLKKLIKMAKIVKIKINKTIKGHQVQFSIGNQTFRLQEQLQDDGLSSKEYAKWYKKMLKAAFSNYENMIKNT